VHSPRKGLWRPHTCFGDFALASPPAQIICDTRGSLLPDPAHDSVLAVCYAVHDDLHYYASDQAGVKGSSIVAEKGVLTLSLRHGLASHTHAHGTHINKAPVSAFSQAFGVNDRGGASASTGTHKGRRPNTGDPGSRDTSAGSSGAERSGVVDAHQGAKAATPVPSDAQPSDAGVLRAATRTARQTLFGPGQENFIGLGKDVKVERAVSEVALLKLVCQLFRRLDPDIVLGYEVQNSSLGYLLARGQHLGVRTLRWGSFWFVLDITLCLPGVPCTRVFPAPPRSCGQTVRCMVA